MKVAVLAHGSRGDIQPMLAVGDELKRRGHKVRLTVNLSSARWAARAGLDIIPMRPDVEAFLKSPQGREMLANGRLVAFLRELARQEAEDNGDLTRACREACEGADLILSTVLTGYRGATLERVLDVPHLGLCTMPIVNTSHFASYLSPIRDLRVGWMNRLSWQAHIALYWMGQKGILNEARRSAGLPDWDARPRLEDGPVIGVFSKHLAPIPEDSPAGHWQGGHPTPSTELRDRLGEGTLPPGLDAWLERGPAPVFFGFGSMPVQDPAALMVTVKRLCKRHSVRALIGSGWTEYAQGDLPDDIFVAPAFDHDRVLPRCLAAVHHGGAGTTHASLRAGLPTLVCSIFGDQPFWGFRTARLGVGTTFPFQQWSEARVSAALELLLRPETKERAQKIGRALRAERGTEQVAELIERFAREQGVSVMPVAAQANVA